MARPRSDISIRIAHAARRRFLEDGVDGASLRRIARDAGTNIGMIYYYYETKDDLFHEVVEEVYGALLADIGQALLPDAPTRERIRRLYVRLGKIDSDELEVIQLVVREALRRSARFERLFERFQLGHIALMLSTVVDGKQDGSLRADLHPALLALGTFVLGVVPQLVRRVAGDRFPFGGAPAGDELADQLVDMLFSGIGGAVAIHSGARGLDSPSK